MKNYKTENQSFINISKELRDKYNVRNNDFVLELYDEDLIGVDPHSPNLTQYQMAKIYIEITKNRWYFLREVVRIPVAGSDIPYQINFGNLALTYLKSMNVNQITLLPRQFGKTIGNITDDVWIFYFGATNTNINYLNKAFSDSKEGLKRFKDIRDLMPRFLLDIVMNRNDKDAQERKESKNFNNSLSARNFDPIYGRICVFKT